MHTKLLLLAAAGIASAFGASAQRDGRYFEEDVVTVFVNEDSADPSHVEKSFKSNAPSKAKDNGLPRFAIVGKDHEFYLGIGAQFLGEAVYDFGDNMPSTLDFIPSSITRSTPGNGGSLGFGWQTSSIYMNIVAMPHSDNKIGLFMKADFDNNGNFTCSHFYGRYRGLTVGYTSTLFNDGAAEPVTIDDQGPNGYPDLTVFTAYWLQNFTQNFSGAIGIDAPTASFTTDSYNAVVNQRIPAIPLYLQYAWEAGKSHVRLSGLVRPMQYRNLVAEKNSTLVGLGVQLSGMATIAGPLSFQYNAAYGRGIGTYIQDDNGLGLDATYTGNAGELSMVKTLGLTGGLSLNLSSKVSANLTYSHVTNWLGAGGTVDGDTYRYGDYVAANVIYNINRFVSAGIEYDYGHRKSFDGIGLHTNRLQCQFAVTF